MSEISEGNGICTQITTVRLDPDNLDEILKLMVERAHFMAKQPGFVSVNLHRQPYRQLCAVDERRQACQGASFGRVPQGVAALRRPGREIEPCLYDVVHVEAA